MILFIKVYPVYLVKSSLYASFKKVFNNVRICA